MSKKSSYHITPIKTPQNVADKMLQRRSDISVNSIYTNKTPKLTNLANTIIGHSNSSKYSQMRNNVRLNPRFSNNQLEANYDNTQPTYKIWGTNYDVQELRNDIKTFLINYSDDDTNTNEIYMKELVKNASNSLFFLNIDCRHINT